MTRIVIAEDHHLVRKGIKSLLSDQATIEIVGEAANGFEAAELTEKLKPDVLLLDLSLPRLSGVSVIRRLTGKSKTRILVLTMHADNLNMREALGAGALGYVLKDSRLEELMSAIEAVSKGVPFIAQKMRDSAMKSAMEGLLRPATRSEDPCQVLTPRERLVLSEAALGLSNSEIAEKLFISPRTVESHRAKIMKKLNLSHQTDLVRFAIREKVIAA